MEQIDCKSSFVSMDGQRFMRHMPADMDSALIALDKAKGMDGIPSIVAIDGDYLILTTLQDGTTDFSAMDIRQTRLVLNRLLDILIELEKIGVTSMSLKDSVVVSPCDHSLMVYGITNALFHCSTDDRPESNGLNVEYARFAQHIVTGKTEPPSLVYLINTAPTIRDISKLKSQPFLNGKQFLTM